jgi:hypothetical protein
VFFRKDVPQAILQFLRAPFKPFPSKAQQPFAQYRQGNRRGIPRTRQTPLPGG